MDANGVRRRDTTKGPPLRILSLDGGGVRGYSMLIIIQELMHRTFVETEGRAPRRHEIPKPCDHFDLIFGTGTGGLIALMLGRLRLDLETCKELYVQMTRMVFETDKTIAGIPYRSTLFKASKLEEAIKQAVQEHTASETEGNDGARDEDVVNPLSSARYSSAGREPRRHASNASTVSFSARSPSAQMRPLFHGGRGDPNARLYDHRDNRTKTALTAMYKGSPRGAPPCILRSYDSRHEPAPEFDCKIWQAGRATCAVGLAFKPVSVGQSTFHDDGVGTFNPSPEALDEAVVKEWPGREVGVFVSIGTGRRPKGSDANQHMWYEGFLGEFAEARRKLISKIEGCEKIHEHMLRDLLIKRGVNVENYYRLNVEVGVGEFGMNEWHRLGEISTSTRRYMGREMEQKMIRGISSKLSKISKAKIRFDRAQLTGVPELVKTTSSTDFETPFAVELPGDTPDPSPGYDRLSRTSFESGQDTLPHDAQGHSPRPSLDPNSRFAQQYADPSDKYVVQNNPQHRYTSSGASSANGDDIIAITSPDERPRLPQLPPRSSELPQQEFVRPLNAPPQTRMEPPPLPPKTPLPESQRRNEDKRRSAAVGGPPYPMDEEEPPAVNLARKPDFRGR